MDIYKLSAKAREFGIWVNIFNKKLFTYIANDMGDNENILLIIKGHDIKTSYKYPAVITDKAVYVAKKKFAYGGVKKWAIPFENIKNVFIARGFFTYSVVIPMDFENVIIGRLSKEKADKIIEVVSKFINKNITKDE